MTSKLPAVMTKKFGFSFKLLLSNKNSKFLVKLFSFSTSFSVYNVFVANIDIDKNSSQSNVSLVFNKSGFILTISYESFLNISMTVLYLFSIVDKDSPYNNKHLIVF